MLILKQNIANSVPTPPVGKGTIFLNEADAIAVKTSDGNIQTFPTTGGANTQVFYNDDGGLQGSPNFTWDNLSNTLTVSNGNVVATGVKTDNLYYANGNPWDLQQPAGSNTAIQFNDANSFGGSANFVWNNSTNTLTVTGTSNVSGNLNVTSNVSAGNVSATGITGTTLTGSLTTASQPNITTVGSLTNLSVAGNAVISGNLTVDGNVTYVNVDTLAVEDPVITLGGGPNGNALTSNDGKDRGTLLNYFTSTPVSAFMGWDNSNGEFGFGSSVTVVNDVVTFTNLGNIRASTIIANVSATTVAGTLTTAAQPNITSVGTLTSAAVTGNVTAGNVYANSGTVGASLLTGTLTTAAQPNVTSVGTLSSLSVTANVTAGGVKTDNLYYANGNPWDLQQPGGSNTQIQFNDADGFGGSAAFTFDKSSNVITASGNINANNFNATTTVTAGNIYANSGTVGATNLTGTLTTAAQPNITSVGTLTSAAVTGNVTAGNVYANSGTIGANVVTGNLVGGTLTTAAQPNVTSVGTLTSLTVTGTATAGNLSTGGNASVTGNATVTGNISGGNVTTGGVVSATGNVSGGNVNTGGVVVATGNVSGGNLTTAGVVAATGNVSGGNLTTAGALSVTGNANVGNIGAAGGVFTGTVTAGNIYANSGTIGATNLTGTLTTASQPNITSVGNLTNLNVAGNAIITGNLTIDGNITYVNTETLAIEDPVISLGGGPNNAPLTSNDGKDRGTLLNYFTTAPVYAFMGWDNSNAEFSFGSNVGIVNDVISYNALGNVRVGNIIGNGQALTGLAGTNVTGQVGNALVAGTVYTAAQPNITSVGTLTSLSVTGNANVGNLGTAGLVTATGNVTGGNLVTGGALSVTGNANVGNIGAAAGVFTTVAGSLTTAAQPNITSVGTLTSLAVTGNATAGNVYANSGTIGAATLKGEGGNISNIQGANVSGAVATATNAGTVTTAAQPNITSVGTLTSLAVTGNTSSGNFIGALANGNSNVNIPTAGGNINFSVNGTANDVVITDTGINVAGTLNATGNANVGNLGTGGLIAATGNVSGGNLTTGGVVAATGNVSGGNLTTGGVLSVTGNANVGNLGTAGLITATGNVTGGNLVTGGVLTVTGTGVSSIAGNLDMTSNTIINLATPTNPTDAATKQYVDDVAQGLNIHDSVQAATPDTLANITGGTITYNNGTAGVGANLVTTGSFNLIDGVNVQTAGTRILVKSEANAVLNGIYTWSNATVITRATDYDTVPEVEAGDFVFCTGGTLYDNTGWVQTDSPAAIGTPGNTITFTQFSGAGTYQAGTGLTLNGSTFSISNTAVTAGSYGNGDRIATFTVNNQGQLTAAANTAITANAANLTGTTLAATVVNSSLTSVGTLGSLNVTNKVTAGQLQGEGGNISNIQGANVSGTVATATTAGTVTTAAQPNITSVGTLTSLAVTGNITGGNLIGPYANGNSNVNIPAAAGNVNISVNGTANVAVVTATGVNVAGTLNATGNANVGNIGATRGVFTNIAGEGGNISNIQGANVSGTVSSATTAGTVTTNAQPNITSVGTLTSVAVTGNATAGNVYANSGTIGASLLTGTLTTAAQPNITSVGTLTSLSVTGNATAGNFIGTFANGNSSIAIPAANGNINFNVAGVSNELVITATGVNVAGTLNATGNANVGNIGATNGVFTNVSGNGSALTAITGGNVTGQVANALVAGTVYTAAQPNITSVGTLTSLAVTGNVTAGNIVAPVANGNSSLNIPAAAGNVNISVNGTANVAVVTATGVNVAGTLNATGAGTIGGDLAVSGNAVITGNLAVNGNLTYLNVDTLAVEDPIIQLQTGANGAAPTSNSGKDVGTGLNYYDTAARVAFMGWDVSNAEFGLASVATIAADVVTFTTYGNLRVGNIIGNGQALTGLAGANVTGQVGNALVAGTVYTAAQPNITSVGTLTSLGVSGAVTASTLVSNVATGTAPLTVTSTTRVANLNVATAGAADSATTAGTVTTAAQPNITSVGTLTSLGVNGTVTAVAFTANTGVFTGNGSGLSAIAGANVTGTVSSATTAGTVTTAAQGNITSLGTLTSLGVNGTVTAVNITANTGVFTGNANGLSSLQSGNLVGTIAQARLANSSVTLGSTALTLGSTVTTVAGLSSVTSTTFVGALSGAATTAGTVTTAAQPNITSVGTLTGLTLANAAVISVGSNTNVGTFTGNFSLSAGSRLNATYADLAEKYVADATYEPGTVLEFGGEFEVTLANAFDSTRVAGVVTTNPAYTMNNECEGEHVATIALQGRVPVKVAGNIAKGDLLVSASNGHAVANNEARAGTIIGKSLENFSGENGIIEVAVGRF